MAGVKQPTDKSHFILPDLGEGVHEAELISWKVKPGDSVEEHQTLAEMETDKALVEVPSPWAGTIKNLGGHEEGDIVNVGDILLHYEGDGSASPSTETPDEAEAEAESETEEEREDAGTVVGSVGGAMSIPERFARREHEANGPPTATKALATPAVRRIARDAGIDINQVPGTGRGGRVTASDVQNFVRRGGAAHARERSTAREESGRMAPSARAVPVEPVSVSPDGTSEVIPFRGVRRKIAESLDRSVKTAVHFTVVDEADVTELDKKRREYARVLGRKFSFLPFIMTACCQALRRHPIVNANVDDDAGEIHVKGVINLGIAVDTDHGLMVPVIEQTDGLSLAEMGDAVSEVATGCRDRTIERERLVGGTFTISNVGSYGGMFATPIINYPEVAILGAGRAREKVMTRGGMFYAGLSMPLSLSCDHRVVDGAEGARFLNTVVKLLENPDDLLA